MFEINISPKFRSEGIRFECVPGCTKCCAIPGMVFVKSDEIPRMARFFKLSEEEFIEEHLKRHWGDVYHFNFPDSEPCIYLRPEGCSIYEVRPAQCRTFPFWPENVSNLKTWKGLKKMCPGIDRGRLYLIDEIREILEDISFGPFL